MCRIALLPPAGSSPAWISKSRSLDSSTAGSRPRGAAYRSTSTRAASRLPTSVLCREQENVYGFVGADPAVKDAPVGSSRVGHAPQRRRVGRFDHPGRYGHRPPVRRFPRVFQNQIESAIRFHLDRHRPGHVTARRNGDGNCPPKVRQPVSPIGPGRGGFLPAASDPDWNTGKHWRSFSPVADRAGNRKPPDSHRERQRGGPSPRIARGDADCSRPRFQRGQAHDTLRDADRRDLDVAGSRLVRQGVPVGIAEVLRHVHVNAFTLSQGLRPNRLRGDLSRGGGCAVRGGRRRNAWCGRRSTAPVASTGAEEQHGTDRQRDRSARPRVVKRFTPLPKPSGGPW